MKNYLLKSSLVLTVFMLVSFTGIEDVKVDKHVLGTWEYEAPDAPYEYQNGDMVFEMKDDKLTGYVSIDGYKIELESLKADKSKVSGEIYVEGTSVMLELEFSKKTFTGTATYSEGSLDLSGTKK